MHGAWCTHIYMYTTKKQNQNTRIICVCVCLHHLKQVFYVFIGQMIVTIRAQVSKHETEDDHRIASISIETNERICMNPSRTLYFFSGGGGDGGGHSSRESVLVTVYYYYLSLHIFQFFGYCLKFHIIHACDSGEFRLFANPKPNSGSS